MEIWDFQRNVGHNGKHAAFLIGLKKKDLLRVTEISSSYMHPITQLMSVRYHRWKLIERASGSFLGERVYLMYSRFFHLPIHSSHFSLTAAPSSHPSVYIRTVHQVKCGSLHIAEDLSASSTYISLRSHQGCWTCIRFSFRLFGNRTYFLI